MLCMRYNNKINPLISCINVHNVLQLCATDKKLHNKPTLCKIKAIHLLDNTIKLCNNRSVLCFMLCNI